MTLPPDLKRGGCPNCGDTYLHDYGKGRWRCRDCGWNQPPPPMRVVEYSAEEVRAVAMADFYNRGMSLTQIGAMFGMNKRSVSRFLQKHGVYRPRVCTGVPKVTKPACPKGHYYTRANTYWHAGRRRCATCKKEATAAYRAANAEAVNARNRASYAARRESTA